MILIEAGETSAAAFRAKVLFANQLAARGYAVLIDEAGLPATAPQSLKYDVARFLGDPAAHPPSHALVIGAQHLADETLARLRSHRFAEDVGFGAVGYFPDHQSLVSSRAKLAYTLGKEPLVVNLFHHQRAPLMPQSALPQVVAIEEAPPVPPARLRLSIILPDMAPEEPETRRALLALDMDHRTELRVIRTDDPGEPQDSEAVTALRLEDLLPQTVSRHSDILVIFGQTDLDERLAATILAAIGSGKPVIDCTPEGLALRVGAPVLRGPQSLTALGPYLDSQIRANLSDIRRFALQSPWLAASALDRLERALGLSAPPAERRPGRDVPPRMLFMPTNGVGLGHAQRLSLIATEMKAHARCDFAAFPSCVPMIGEKGFACLPLVQKSPDHPEPYANDLVNYRRLDRVLPQGGNFVFDGGFVFESIFRLIQEKELNAVWLRRGLWRPEHFNQQARDRGRIFRRIVVPLEAFDELNAPVEWGSGAQHIGPVVQMAKPDPDLRARLQDHLGLRFDRLVVSMLGAGIAAERSAQVQMLCSHFERRPDCLHLVVSWPGARAEPGAYPWRNSRVVQTRQALAFAQAADMVISAAGYNSFHEVLYHRIPAIFIPQTAPFMDDQDRRASAARDRGLAEMVAAHELVRLERELCAFLDAGKAETLRAALSAITLPQTGTAAAARLFDDMVRQ